MGPGMTPVWAPQRIGSLWLVLSGRDISVPPVHAFLAVSVAPTGSELRRFVVASIAGTTMTPNQLGDGTDFEEPRGIGLRGRAP